MDEDLALLWRTCRYLKFSGRGKELTLNTEKAQVLRAGTSRAILRLNKSIYYSISIPISFLVG